MDHIICEEVYVAKDTILQENSGQADRIPNLGPQGRLALYEGVEEEKVGCAEVYSLDLLHLDDCVQGHEYVDLESFYLLVPE